VTGYLNTDFDGFISVTKNHWPSKGSPWKVNAKLFTGSFGKAIGGGTQNCSQFVGTLKLGQFWTY